MEPREGKSRLHINECHMGHGHQLLCLCEVAGSSSWNPIGSLRGNQAPLFEVLRSLCPQTLHYQTAAHVSLSFHVCDLEVSEDQGLPLALQGSACSG